MVSIVKKLAAYNIILASQSPRRHQFFKEMNIPFQVRIKETDENYPSYLSGAEIPVYIAQKKAQVFVNELSEKDILITSDTLIWFENKAIGKPKNYEEGFKMLKLFSGNTHQVISAICFTTLRKQYISHCVTKVTFNHLTDEEIDYYLSVYKPYDKAGSYGIQEWIGSIGITYIEGSYNNVVGFPTHLIKEAFYAVL